MPLTHYSGDREVRCNLPFDQPPTYQSYLSMDISCYKNFDQSQIGDGTGFQYAGPFRF